MPLLFQHDSRSGLLDWLENVAIFDEIFKFRCTQWWKFHQNNIFVSVDVASDKKYAEEQYFRFSLSRQSNMQIKARRMKRHIWICWGLDKMVAILWTWLDEVIQNGRWNLEKSRGTAGISAIITGGSMIGIMLDNTLKAIDYRILV